MKQTIIIVITLALVLSSPAFLPTENPPQNILLDNPENVVMGQFDNGSCIVMIREDDNPLYTWGEIVTVENCN